MLDLNPDTMLLRVVASLTAGDGKENTLRASYAA